MVSFDYVKKEININDKIFPSGNFDDDIKILESLVIDVATKIKN